MLNIDTLVSLCIRPWAPEGAASGITVVTTSILLPLVNVTLMWTVARAAAEISTLSPALRARILANAIFTGESVTVPTFEGTRILRGTLRGRVVRVVAGLSILRYLQCGHVSHHYIEDAIGWRIGGRCEERWPTHLIIQIVRDRRGANERSRCREGRVGLDAGGNR